MGNSYRAYFSLTREQMEIFSLKFPDGNLNTIAKQVFLEAMDGRTQSKELKGIDNELKLQKLKNMRKDGAIKDLTIYQTFKQQNKPISLDELIEISTGKKDAQQLLFRTSNQGTTTPNETNNQNPSKDDEVKTPIWIKILNRLCCYDCYPKHSFEYQEGYKSTMIEAVDKCTAHKMTVHNRGLNESERLQLVEFLNEVDKIA